jgi:hypothetical protein
VGEKKVELEKKGGDEKRERFVVFCFSPLFHIWLCKRGEKKLPDVGDILAVVTKETSFLLLALLSLK